MLLMSYDALLNMNVHLFGDKVVCALSFLIFSKIK